MVFTTLFHSKKWLLSRSCGDERNIPSHSLAQYNMLLSGEGFHRNSRVAAGTGVHGNLFTEPDSSP